MDVDQTWIKDFGKSEANGNLQQNPFKLPQSAGILTPSPAGSSSDILDLVWVQQRGWVKQPDPQKVPVQVDSGWKILKSLTSSMLSY